MKKSEAHSNDLFECEDWADEQDLLVTARSHSHSYSDERNWQIVPPGQFVAERDC